MKEAFKEVRFRPESVRMIDTCREILAEYEAEDLKLTLRQLYYQLVSRNEIPNTERSYKNLGKLVSEARLAGLIDWDVIEDRVRVPRIPQDFDNLKELADEYHVTLAVNRGYSSQSAMYEASRRIRRNAWSEAEKSAYILYLGDHDPSGEDMVRDIRDRLELFNPDTAVTVMKIALTFEQVKQHRLPPNPAKMSDSRCFAYVAKFGKSCWEVDALPPDMLQRLIRRELDDMVDKGLMEKVMRQEEKDKKALTRAVREIMGAKR